MRDRDAALDSEILSVPFGIPTNWRVITGATCSGKTTIINLIAERGFPIVAETGRAYIESELALGRTLEDLRAKESIFQRKLQDLRLEVEHDLNPDAPLFLDRALPDFITFYRVTGLNPNEILEECLHYRYACVFVLDRLPLERDGVRKEDEADSDFIDEWLSHDYEALGYEVVRVPVLSIDERLEYILGKIPNR